MMSNHWPSVCVSVRGSGRGFVVQAIFVFSFPKECGHKHISFDLETIFTLPYY